MKSDGLFFIELLLSFLPFVLFVFLNEKANIKRKHRERQYPMPVVAVFFSAFLMIFLHKVNETCLELFLRAADLCEKMKLTTCAEWIRNRWEGEQTFLLMVLLNTLVLLLYVGGKRVLTEILGRKKIAAGSTAASVVEIFYAHDRAENRWYMKEQYGQARTFVKAAYYGGCVISGAALLISCGLYQRGWLNIPFYPIFAVILIGEMSFFLDGMEKEEGMSLEVQLDRAEHAAMYPLLRKPLKALFGDKLSAEGTTVNVGGVNGGAIEDILVGLERNGGHIGKNYAAFIRGKMETGLRPNADYLRCGYDLANRKSLLFNTPFYDKLNPYVFYAMQRELLTEGKILIVLGRHGTEDDLRQWVEQGMKEASNLSGLWKMKLLDSRKMQEEDLPDVGIISRSGVHDLDIHKNSLPFLRRVSFMIVVEPSKLVTTAQIGLSLLVKCCGKERPVTFCSVDRNCDGLVDALSHILMTDITEVSATEYPHGMSSYMCWTSDDDYLQHRILPGVSRFLGMGTELSAVALKHQVKKTVWYGGEAFPVLDVHWIAKQYYHDLLEYARLPANQDTFDACFQSSFHLCNEKVSDFSFITVEDDRNNVFEMQRNFATIAKQQGFVNVISSEYMLREYMTANPTIFTSDPKAIPYITADYARTKRNAILSLCLLLCIDSVQKEVLCRQMVMLNMNAREPVAEIWMEICTIYGGRDLTDKQGVPILSAKTKEGREVFFEQDKTVLSRREYSLESGKYEDVYTITNADFSRMILDDLQNASYIAEHEGEDIYIGTELKGHVYQKYVPGQFFTLSGKYYEMVSATSGNRILVRRASDHIGGRLAYRQVRDYTVHHLEDIPSMGALKSVNNIGICYQYADFSVETPGYWKLRARNDFDHGTLVKVNGVPVREYHHKLLLKLDFSQFGDEFTDSVRMTLTNLLNEAFVTLFAENQAFISAVTPGAYEAPLTYSLHIEKGTESTEKCIFIVEDSQLDIGLLIAVERNLNRIFQIIADYLTWNEEKIVESIDAQVLVEEDPDLFDIYAEAGDAQAKKRFFERVIAWAKKVLERRGKSVTAIPVENKEKQDLSLEENTTFPRKEEEESFVENPEESTDEWEFPENFDEELPEESIGTEAAEGDVDGIFSSEESVMDLARDEDFIEEEFPEDGFAEDTGEQEKREVSENGEREVLI